MNFTVKAVPFKKVVKAAYYLVTESRVKFSDTGLLLGVVDPANVCLLRAKIPREDFEVWNLDGEELMIGVDITRLNDILKIFSGENIEIKLDGKTAITLRQGNIKYTLALIAPEAVKKMPKPPEGKDLAKVIITGAEFKQIVDTAGKLSDEVVFITDTDGFRAEAEGDVDRVFFSKAKDDIPDFNGLESRSRFSLEYIQAFAKVVSPKDIVQLKIGTNWPVEITIRNPDYGATIQYVLAPRLEK